MAARHTVLILRASDGEPLEEVPANGLTIGKVLTGMGGCTFSLPVSEKSSRALIAPGQGREVAVIRNGTTCIFNGPILNTRRSLEGTVAVQAADPGYYLSRRTTDGPRNYGRNVLAVVKDLVDTALGVPPRFAKPNASLYRLTVDPISGGPVKRWAIGSRDRLPIFEMIQDLADDDVGGFDFRWDYTYTPVGQSVSRIFRLGHPTLGVDRPDAIVEPPALLEFSDTEGIERAATRVHVVGAGTGKGKRLASAVNTGAHNAGLPLLESVIERTNVSNQATLNGMANAYRRILNPPGRLIETTHRVSGGAAEGGLGWGVADLGDRVRVRVYASGEELDIRRRIVAETLNVSDDGEENLSWIYNDPTEDVIG